MAFTTDLKNEEDDKGEHNHDRHVQAGHAHQHSHIMPVAAIP